MDTGRELPGPLELGAAGGDRGFDGQRVLVTGSSRGIGAEIARAFARRGAEVALHGRDRSALQELRSALAEAGLRAELHVADVTDVAQVQRLAGEVGRVDVLVVNAGGAASGFGPLEEIDDSVFRESLESNLTSAFLTVKAFLPAMKARKSGSVVLVSSASAHIAHPRSPIAYAAAKAGLESMTKNLAVQAGPFGIRVNCIAPEAILTETNKRLMPDDVQASLAKEHPLQRLGLPSDVANVAVFLASSAASWLTGTIIDVAGGAVTR